MYTKQVIEDAYAKCTKIAHDHYENFPVASFFIPRRLRPAIASVYAFARYADDIADEGSDSQEQRLLSLDKWRQQLFFISDAVYRGKACNHEEETTPETRNSEGIGDLHPIFIALKDTINRFDIPVQHFHDLLDAFVQDTVKRHYETFDEVLSYCKRSANPVGRIILALFGRLNEKTIPYSDALCTGLQLTNFWQDISIDILKPRIYLPQEDLRRYGVSENELLSGCSSSNLRNLIRFEVERSKSFYYQAEHLFSLVPYNLRMELKAVWNGGMRILEKIEKMNYHSYSSRPKLEKFDYFRIFIKAILPTF